MSAQGRAGTAARAAPERADPARPFVAIGGDASPRDQRDLMERPFFSLSKSPRTKPILYRANDVEVQVFGMPEHGMATIWDADVLIWAASQIVEARDVGLRTSRRMRATPYEILTFIGRGTSVRDYQRLKAALDRLQSTASPPPSASPPGGVCIASHGSTNGRSRLRPMVVRSASN